MKHLILYTLTLLLAHATLWAQKQDYTWLLGYPPISPSQKFGGSLLQFGSPHSLRVSFSEVGLMLIPIGEICDNEGNLQFYTNGCEVFNFEHKRMQNGDSLNAPYFTRHEWQTHNCFQGLYYPKLFNGLLPLPLPNSDHEYVLFHLRHDEVPDPAHFPLDATQSLLYSHIDMSANNGLGRVTQKNILMLKDTFCDHLAAVRHGNGRDWWLVAEKADVDSTFMFLLTPDGVQGPYSQKIGIEWPTISSLYMGWQASFAPKGDLYARVNILNGIHLYHFNRCDGTFRNPQVIPFPDTLVSAPGLAFSPNGRWLYFSTGSKLFQYDCHVQDIDASKILIGEYDGFTTAPPGLGLSTSFHQLRLAPDGKIYMSASNAVYYLHIIHNPDARGTDCHFEQHGLELPTYNGFCLPNFPNFRLYDWEDSPCDSLISVATEAPKPEKNGINTFPNPANHRVTVTLPIPLASTGKLRIHSSTGALVHETTLTSAVNNGLPSFDVSTWPPGLYLVTYEAVGKRAQSAKLMVAHGDE